MGGDINMVFSYAIHAKHVKTAIVKYGINILHILKLLSCVRVCCSKRPPATIFALCACVLFACPLACRDSVLDTCERCVGMVTSSSQSQTASKCYIGIVRRGNSVYDEGVRLPRYFEEKPGVVAHPHTLLQSCA